MSLRYCLISFLIWAGVFSVVISHVETQRVCHRVERSLYERAVGYNYEAVKIFMPANAKKPVYAPYVEHISPDVIVRKPAIYVWQLSRSARCPIGTGSHAIFPQHSFLGRPRSADRQHHGGMNSSGTA